MKRSTLLCLALFFSVLQISSQVSFTMASSACFNSTVQATASSGSITSPSYTWLASPAGVVFSNTSSPNPTLTFTAGGTYSVLAVVASGTVLSFAQNTIYVASGTVYVMHHATFATNSVCPQTQFTLSASGGAGTSFSVFTAPNTLTASGTSSLIPLTAPVSGSLPRTYTIVTDSAGCMKNAVHTMYQHHLTVLVSPMPASHAVCPQSQFTLNTYYASGGTTFSVMSTPVTVASSGTMQAHVITAPQILPITYTVLADSSTCTGANTITIHELQLHPQLTASSLSLCSAQSVTLSAMGVGAANYTFVAISPTAIIQTGTSSTAVVNPASSTLYALLADSLGCVGSATQAIIVNPSPMFLSVLPTSNAVCAGYTSTLTAFGAISYTWTGSTFTGAVIQQSISVGPGTYTVFGISAGGCTASSTIAIALAPPLNIFVTPLNSSNCIAVNSTSVTPASYKHVALSASGAASYTLYPPPPAAPVVVGANISVNPSVTTQYTIAGSTALCSGAKTITVSVFPQFTIAASPALATICVGEAITLSLTEIGAPVNSPFTYSWTEQDQSLTSLNSTTSQSVIALPVHKRGYSVTVTDGNGCISAPTSLTIDVSPCLGVADNDFTDPIRVYPNPVKDFLIISVADASTLNVFDLYGKLILSKSATNEEKQVMDLSALKPGMYFMDIQTSNGKRQNVKFLKE